MIAIIDYGSGNVAAIANIYKQLKVDYLVTSNMDEIKNAEKYILPGVGAFDKTMNFLDKSGLVDVLNDQVVFRKKKVLGICVGMQILGETSEEGVLPGLGWIKGRIRKIDTKKILQPPLLPHMGWNNIAITRSSPMLTDVDIDLGFYFLHSYYFDVDNPHDVVATVEYGGNFPCVVAHGNVYGVQFHPEKSHANGLAIFRNFAESR